MPCQSYVYVDTTVSTVAVPRETAEGQRGRQGQRLGLEEQGQRIGLGQAATVDDSRERQSRERDSRGTGTAGGWTIRTEQRNRDSGHYRDNKHETSKDTRRLKTP